MYKIYNLTTQIVLKASTLNLKDKIKYSLNIFLGPFYTQIT